MSCNDDRSAESDYNPWTSVLSALEGFASLICIAFTVLLNHHTLPLSCTVLFRLTQLVAESSCELVELSVLIKNFADDLSLTLQGGHRRSLLRSNSALSATLASLYKSCSWHLLFHAVTITTHVITCKPAFSKNYWAPLWTRFTVTVLMQKQLLASS